MNSGCRATVTIVMLQTLAVSAKTTGWAEKNVLTALSFWRPPKFKFESLTMNAISIAQYPIISRVHT